MTSAERDNLKEQLISKEIMSGQVKLTPSDVTEDDLKHLDDLISKILIEIHKGITNRSLVPSRAKPVNTPSGTKMTQEIIK